VIKIIPNQPKKLVTVVLIFKQCLDYVKYITSLLPNFRLKECSEIYCRVNVDNFRIYKESQRALITKVSKTRLNIPKCSRLGLIYSFKILRSRGPTMCLVLCLLIVLHHVLAGSPLSHDKQLVFLHAFGNQQLCSSMVFFDITGVLRH
jgi:hypothetical protein